MDKYTVKKYTENDFKTWNDFIAQAKNATFLFHRDFMEYHKDRFEDYSLMIFEGEKLVAVLPANKSGEIVYSHQGLTYGGLVLLPASKLYNTTTIFQSILKYLSNEDISTLLFCPPHPTRDPTFPTREEDMGNGKVGSRVGCGGRGRVRVKLKC